MRNTTAAFDVAISKPNKRPQMYVSFIEPTTDTLVIEHFRTHKDKAMIDTASQVYTPGLMNVTFLTGKIDYLAPHITPGQATIIIQENYDTNKTFSNWLLANRVIGATCSAYLGFEDLTVEDYLVLFSGDVNSITLVDNLTWELKVRETLLNLSTPTVKNLTGAVSIGGLVPSSTFVNTNAPSFTSDIFIDPLLNNPFFPIGGGRQSILKTCIKIGDEIIRYDDPSTNTIISGSVLRQSLNGLTRGYANTTAGTHLNNDRITQILAYEGSPLEVALALLLTTDEGVTINFDTVYDTNAYLNLGGTDIGLGFSTNQIDIEAFESMAWKKHVDQEGDIDNIWLIDSEISNLLDYIEDKILKPIGAYLVIRVENPTPGISTGVISKVTVKDFDWVDIQQNFDSQVVANLDENDTLNQNGSFKINRNSLVSRFEWKYKSIDTESIPGVSIRRDANDQTFFSNFDLVNSAYGNVGVTLKNELIAALSPINITTIGDIPHQSLLKQLGYHRFVNQDPFIEFDLDTTLDNIVLEPSDRVTYSNSKLPSITGVNWNNAKVIINNVTFNFIRGNLRLSCLTFTEFKRVLNGQLYSINSIDISSITKKNTNLNSDFSNISGFTDDGHYDNTVTVHKAHLMILKVEITEPGQPVDSDFYETQQISIQSSAIKNSVFQCFNKVYNIKYDYTLSRLRTYDIHLWSTSHNTEDTTVRIIPDTVKLDFFAASVGAGNPLLLPVVRLVGLDFIRFHFDF